MRVRRERWLLRDEDGASIILVAVSLLMIFALSALAIDAGALWAKRRSLVSAADAAALAAAVSCARGYGEADATSTANDYAVRNVSAATLTAGYPEYPMGCDPTGGRVTVRYTAPQDLYFAPVLGLGHSQTIAATSTAVWGGAGAADVVPIMLSGVGQVLSNCTISPDLPDGTACHFWYDQDNIASAQWGLLNLNSWGAQPTDACNAFQFSGESDISNWTMNGFGQDLALKDPPPTYVCDVSGVKVFSSLVSHPENFFQPGDVKVFPVNNAEQQVMKGDLIDKYAIVAFASLKIEQVLRGKAGAEACEMGRYTGQGDAFCLVTTWDGYTSSGAVPGGGSGAFGTMAVRLVP